MPYETKYFRAPDKAGAIADVKSEMQNAGMDPYRRVLLNGPNGDRFNRAIITVHPAGTWHKVQPTFEAKDGELVKTDPGVVGDHCLLNFRTDDEELLRFVDSFPATDPKLAPSEVADSEKGPNGLSRIDAPATPIRPIAT